MRIYHLWRCWRLCTWRLAMVMLRQTVAGSWQIAAATSEGNRTHIRHSPRCVTPTNTNCRHRLLLVSPLCNIREVVHIIGADTFLHLFYRSFLLHTIRWSTFCAYSSETFIWFRGIHNKNQRYNTRMFQPRMWLIISINKISEIYFAAKIDS